MTFRTGRAATFDSASRVRRLAILIVGVLLVGGCSAAAPDAPALSAGTTASSAPTPPVVANPTAISIPAIGAHSTLIPLGLTGVTEDCPQGGCLAVPPVDTPEQAAWYAGADPAVDGDEYKPGDPDGPAVITGHVDGTGPDGQHGYPGVFARLGELTVGDAILIDRADGSQLTFVVTAVERYSKTALPWDRIMAKTEKPSMRAITCGGSFDRAAGHYTENLVAYAELTPDQP